MNIQEWWQSGKGSQGFSAVDGGGGGMLRRYRIKKHRNGIKQKKCSEFRSGSLGIRDFIGCHTSLRDLTRQTYGERDARKQ